jgi:Tfp pilus assembly protein PilV
MALLEVLISLSVMVIGVLAVLGLLVTARRDAEMAAHHAALALAARQVLELHTVGRGPDLPWELTLPVGAHRVRVTLEAESASAELLRLRCVAREEAGGGDWIVETLSAGP